MERINTEITDITGLIQGMINEERNRLESIRAQVMSNYGEQMRAEETLFHTRMALSQRLSDAATGLRLGSSSPLTGSSKLSLAQSQFRSGLGQALSGDVDAAGRLQGLAQAYAEASSGQFASTSKHKTIMDEILSGLDRAAEITRPSKASFDQVMQSLNEQMLAELATINVQLSNIPANLSESIAPHISYLVATLTTAGFSPAKIGNIVSGIPGGKEAAPEIVAQSTPDESIRAYIKATRKSGVTGLDLVKNVYNAAKKMGIGIDQLSGAIGYSPEEIMNALAAVGVRQYAMGGSHQGGTRIVGERGFEIESTGPSRIFSNTQSLAMLDGGRELIAEVIDIKSEIKSLKYIQLSGWQHSGRQREQLISATEESGNGSQVVGSENYRVAG